MQVSENIHKICSTSKSSKEFGSPHQRRSKLTTGTSHSLQWAENTMHGSCQLVLCTKCQFCTVNTDAVHDADNAKVITQWCLTAKSFILIQHHRYMSSDVLLTE